MKDDELVKALRWLSTVRVCETKLVNCHECEFHGLCTDPDSDESIASQIILHEQAANTINTLRNELCEHCGRYKEAHNGACDGCRWKKGE